MIDAIDAFHPLLPSVEVPAHGLYYEADNFRVLGCIKKTLPPVGFNVQFRL